MSVYIGLDIGGTKCAVSVGVEESSGFRIVRREAIPTPGDQLDAMEHLCALAEALRAGETVAGIGISAGGPMDAPNGILHNPPNLPGWRDVSLTRFASEKLNAPCIMENDANACALAEWRWGAGQGTRNMVFLTFGTGLGSGIVLDGHILRGATGDAGEVGHWRLFELGPTGYGKLGSFEGFCSGGGIRQLALTLGEQARQNGREPAYWKAEHIDAKTVAEAARAGDETAREVFAVCGDALGRGLALIVDFLNPECIVLGSIYTRSGDLLEPTMRRALARDALPHALAGVRVAPAMLGDRIGDYAALALAKQASESKD
ncbi:MAG TPA: ROK family protein [Candidatus Limiplasma sp.]|nr:ROK family protein [Candidatus Limiplasma sp.]HPS80590.1 ROK family protein [Candidatus Limiplasma sp.]